MIAARKMRISCQNAYFGKNAFYFLVAWQYYFHACRILPVPYQTAAGTGKTVQREYIPMLLKEPPYLCLFPTPASAKSLQRQGRTVVLNSGRQMRKDILRILPHGMTPEIQPRIRFLESNPLFGKPVRDISGQTEETIFLRCIHTPIQAGRAGTSAHPVSDDIFQLFGGAVERIGEVSERLQLI